MAHAKTELEGDHLSEAPAPAGMCDTGLGAGLGGEHGELSCWAAQKPGVADKPGKESL